jgi:uncharacterized protein
VNRIVNLPLVLSAFLIFILFFLTLYLYTKLAGPVPFYVNSVTTQKSETFNVTGEGKVTATPDKATVVVGVQAQGTTVQEAQDKLNGAINKVSTAIKGVGIDAGDIKTDNYSINPNIDYQNNQKITGYNANTNLTVTIKDVSKANQVIDQATKAGANQVGNVQFDVADQTKFQDQAREKAVADAKKKAEDAARIAGFSLGKIINYAESQGGGVPRPYAMAADAKSAPGVAAVPTQVEPGSNEIVVSVTLSYEIR